VITNYAEGKLEENPAALWVFLVTARQADKGKDIRRYPWSGVQNIPTIGKFHETEPNFTRGF
jgi:hypothetical protein